MSLATLILCGLLILAAGMIMGSSDAWPGRTYEYRFAQVGLLIIAMVVLLMIGRTL